MSPSTTHTDITAQATFHLDWTRVILGLGGGSDLDEDTPPGHFSSATRNPSSSQQRQKSEGHLGNSYNLGKDLKSGASLRTEEQVINPLTFESRKPPNRGNSVFSTFHDPQRFDIFGNINSDMSMPETTRNAFGFGDGPLFPRPASQATKMRADSAPPNIRHSSVLNSPHISRSSQSTMESFNKDDNVPFSMKGKECEPETTKAEPKSIIPEVSGGAVPSHFSYSGFGPFDNFTAPFAGVSVSPPPAELRTEEPDSYSSTSSKSISTMSKFSMIHHDHADMSTAPTSAIPPVAVHKGDGTIRVPTVLHDSSNGTTTGTPPVSQINTGSSGKGIQVDSVCTSNQSPSTTNGPGGTKAGANATDSVTAQLHPLRKMSDLPKNTAKKEPLVQTPKKSQSPAPPPPPKQTPAPTPAGPPAAASNQTMRPRSSSTITVPAEFSTLVSVLREQQPKLSSITKTVLGALLIKKDPNVYRRAGCSKFSTYIAAAAKAGIIEESVNGSGDQCVLLRTPYVLQ